MKKRLSRGFSLIELMVTVAIIAVLAGMVLPLTEVAAQRSREVELRANLREIRAAIDAYKQATDEGRVPKATDASGYPPNLDVLVNGVVDPKSPDKRRMYFLRRLPRDPMATDESVAPSMTWGKRSYKSPPDDPREGDDVFDVYSLSTGVGLNGVPYREW
ncbi:MAG: type II secretion system protein [Actinomycetota bacterium]